MLARHNNCAMAHLSNRPNGQKTTWPIAPSGHHPMGLLYFRALAYLTICPFALLVIRPNVLLDSCPIAPTEELRCRSRNLVSEKRKVRRVRLASERVFWRVFVFSPAQLAEFFPDVRVARPCVYLIWCLTLTKGGDFRRAPKPVRFAPKNPLACLAKQIAGRNRGRLTFQFECDV